MLDLLRPLRQLRPLRRLHLVDQEPMMLDLLRLADLEPSRPDLLRLVDQAQLMLRPWHLWRRAHLRLWGLWVPLDLADLWPRRQARLDPSRPSRLRQQSLERSLMASSPF